MDQDRGGIPARGTAEVRSHQRGRQRGGHIRPFALQDPQHQTDVHPQQDLRTEDGDRRRGEGLQHTVQERPAADQEDRGMQAEDGRPGRAVHRSLREQIRHRRAGDRG